MPNPSPKTPKNFPAQQNKYRSGKTKTMRVPIALEPYVEPIVRWADSTDNPEESLKQLMAIAQQLSKQN